MIFKIRPRFFRQFYFWALLCASLLAVIGWVPSCRPESPLWRWGLFVTFIGFTGFFVWYARLLSATSYEVTEDSLIERRAHKPISRTNWSDVLAVELLEAYSVVRVKQRNGASINVPCQLERIEDFVHQVEARSGHMLAPGKVPWLAA